MRTFIGRAAATLLLLLATTPAARADSISPNTRPVPVGQSWEPSLSHVLGCLFYGTSSCDPATTLLTYDALVNQATAGLFSADGAANVTLAFEYTGNQSELGLWSPSGPATSMLPLFAGSATGANNGGATPVSVQFGPQGVTISGNCALVNCQTDLTGSGIDPSAFGFYMRDPIGNTFYSSDFLNTSNEAHALSYTDGSGNWALAFEDQRLGSSDLDYNDEVIVLRDAVASAIPEPGTFVLLAAGLMLLCGRALRRRILA